MRVAGYYLPLSRGTALVAVCLLALALTGALPAHASGSLFGLNLRPKRDGDILKIFDRASVYVVTNDDPDLGDILLDGCQQKDRRILTLDEWRNLPDGASWYVSVVYLINREKLPAREHVPELCLAEGDEVWTQVARMGRNWGIAHEVTISAPDSSYLRRAVEDFRTLREEPRNPLRRNVKSMAIVPIGACADAADVYLKRDEGPLAHLLPADRYDTAVVHLVSTDEVFLVDRSALGSEPVPASVTALLQKRPARPGETLVWRESKEKGRSRVIISAPNGDLLAEAARHYSDPLSIPETPTVFASARDLRSVRRVAVAGVHSGAGGPELARRLASEVATQVRALNAFEVLERAGLSEVLGEIALDQAGITKAKDRAKVRQLAAADALLIVDVTDVQGHTEYTTTQERLTPRMGNPPRKPLEPTRLRVALSLPGKEDDPIARAAMEAMLHAVVGVKTNEEYKEALDSYNCETLPRWRRQVNEYNNRYRTREISWRQDISAKSTATVTGSLRLVDLVDGLVLWEAPFSATENDELVHDTQRAVSVGEDSSPPPPSLPNPSSEAPAALISRAGETALTQAVQALRGTALLPQPVAVADNAAPAPATAPSPPALPVPAPQSSSGRILDVDGDTLLIGFGAADGLKLGDTLVITLPGNATVRVVTTRVRPRTCDAAFDKDAPPALRSLAAIGQTASREVGK